MRKSDPKTKEMFLDRILSFDFDGDIRHLGVEPASIVRTGPNTLRLTFPSSGQTYDISVHKPRGEQPVATARAGESRSFARTEREGPAIEPAPEEAPPAKRKYTRRSAAQGRGRQAQA